MKNVIKVISLFILSVSAYSVNAATINGSFGVNGALDVNGAASLVSVTDITLNTVWGSGASSGDTSNVDFFSTGTGGSASLPPSFLDVDSFINIEGWSLKLTSMNIVDQTESLLTLEGTGILTGNSYEATNATWTFSTSTLSSYDMNVATTVVPVPAAVWLFGSGLIGLVGIARRRV